MSSTITMDRLAEGEDTRTVWEKAGWSRCPRNGREWAMLRAGKPEPESKEKPLFKRPYKCRKCGGRLFYTAGDANRRCVACRDIQAKKWLKAHPEQARAYKQAHIARSRETPEPVDGILTVPISWLYYAMKKVPDVLDSGVEAIIVENFGVPVFAIVPVEKVR